MLFDHELDQIFQVAILHTGYRVLHDGQFFGIGGQGIIDEHLLNLAVAARKRLDVGLER